jgi:hypothetical protein
VWAVRCGVRRCPDWHRRSAYLFLAIATGWSAGISGRPRSARARVRPARRVRSWIIAAHEVNQVPPDRQPIQAPDQRLSPWQRSQARLDGAVGSAEFR